MAAVLPLLAAAFLVLFSGLHPAASTAAAGGEEATVVVKAAAAVSRTDDNFVCATLDWWPRDKCNYGMCPWYNASIINLVITTPET
jgi:heparanase 1